MKLYTDKDVSMDAVKNKKVAIIGFGSQGQAQAACLRDSDVEVIIGVRPEGGSWKKGSAQGFDVRSIPEAVQTGDIVHLLIPDEVQGEVFAASVAPYLRKGQTLSFSHGFSVAFRQIEVPEGIDVIMVAPKGPGTQVRKTYSEGFGVPGLIAVKRNVSGNAENRALAMAKAMGLTRAGVFRTSFEDEAKEDLFGEQAVLCGGLVHLMLAGFEVLTEAGYAPEIAYFETVHEMKLIVDLIYKGGINLMSQVISNTAEWGMHVSGSRIIGPEVKERMKEVLKDIDSGLFAKNWMNEVKSGASLLQQRREQLDSHLLEKTGGEIRALFSSRTKTGEYSQ
jgi:ketol-acid reductoisomerase